MALLKAFVCQVVLLGLYKLFLEQVVEEHLVPDELTRNCIVGFVCLLCFGIQLYTEKVEEQTGHAEASKAKSRRRSPPDTAETVSEFLDARTAHMMRTLDAAMQHMNQMPMSDGYVQNVIFAAAGTEATFMEQTFGKQPGTVLVEEIHTTKLSDVLNDNAAPNVSENEPIVVPMKIEEVSEVRRNNRNEKEEEEEEVEEEEIETKSDVCEEEEEDVVTVIDASKPKPEATESEDEEEEEQEEEQEEEEEEPVVVHKKIEERPVKEPSKREDEDENEEEEESDEEEDEVKQDAGKVTKKS